MNVHIKESKTDPFCLGHTITVGATNSKICSVQALEKYISLRPPIGGPLFIHASGKPLTKQVLTTKTRQLLTLSGFNASNYAGHSYRIGAVTTAAEANLPSWLIKTLGRWSSDCYERYIKTPMSTLSEVSAMLANTSPNFNTVCQLTKKNPTKNPLIIKAVVCVFASRLWGIYSSVRYTFVYFVGLKCSQRSHLHAHRLI